jgi:hypothetical protein
MKLLFDEDLVEAVVSLSAMGRRKGGSALQVRRFHGEREKLYAILDPDERHAAFFKLHLEWFREWGADQILSAVINEFSLLPRYLESIGFRKARNKSEEGADLYVNAEGLRHGIIALLPERFEGGTSLPAFLRHELMHVSDMVDPAFGYSRDIHQPGQTESQRRLVRQRYRLLWDMTVDGRLINAKKSSVATREQRRAEFDRGFAFLPAEKRDQIFTFLWKGSPNHAQLLDLASDPRDLNCCNEQVPGGPCPLCGFATFQWADLRKLAPTTLEGISRASPGWRREEGACYRCIEIFESAVGIELPTTVCV